jgi:hypothetical protein
MDRIRGRPNGLRRPSVRQRFAKCVEQWGHNGHLSLPPLPRDFVACQVIKNRLNLMFNMSSDYERNCLPGHNFTDVSKKLIASIDTIEAPILCLLLANLVYSSTLKVGAVRSPETFTRLHGVNCYTFHSCQTIRLSFLLICPIILGIHGERQRRQIRAGKHLVGTRIYRKIIKGKTSERQVWHTECMTNTRDCAARWFQVRAMLKAMQVALNMEAVYGFETSVNLSDWIAWRHRKQCLSYIDSVEK